MARQRNEEQRILDWFIASDVSAAKALLDKIMLVLQVRGAVPETPRRGRPRGSKPKKEATPDGTE